VTKAENFLGISLEARWEKFCRRLEECRSTCTGESVRKLRVALRKLLTQLDAALQIADCRNGRNARVRLKRELKVVGRLRDVQMQRSRLESLKLNSEAVDDLAGWLKKRERKLMQRIGPSMADLNLPKIKRQITKTADKINGVLGKSGQGREVTLRRLMVKTFRQVNRRYQALDVGDLDTLHDLRIAFKKYRYLKEAFSPDQAKRDGVSALKVYQDKMGEVQDWEVLLKMIHKYCNRQGSGSFRKLTPLRSRILKERDAAVRKFWTSRSDLLQWKGDQEL
jgi:CHAD domain-containing protein